MEGIKRDSNRRWTTRTILFVDRSVTGLYLFRFVSGYLYPVLERTEEKRR